MALDDDIVPAPARPEFKMPPGLEVEPEAGGILISRPLFGGPQRASGALIGGLSAVSFWSIAFPRGLPWPLNPAWQLFFLCCVPVAYFVIAALINDIEIEVARGEIAIKISPLPMGGRTVISGPEVRQVYTRRRRVHRSYQNRGSGSGLLARPANRGPVEDILVTYEVVALTHAGQEHLLIQGLATPQEGITVERLIEEQLGIVDQEVEGELDRGWKPELSGAPPPPNRR